MVVGPTGNDPRALTGERLGEHGRVPDRPPLIVLERLLGRELERDGLAGDHLHERAALHTGEDRLVDRSPQ